ncbi:MAG TPA: aminoacyl-tRNA hydrolase [Bryobacteraceae bacterium]|jgi:PTH1 family peptidyl-tRNA hydrolase|nr:aminoacyl-tRNA hydrolase [Bryobacteraceae bacterium]
MPDFDKLIVGLGNPGPDYEQTAHNLGFMVVDRLAERHAIRVTRKECMALVGQGSIPPCRAMLAKPQTFMNLSGPSVQGLLSKHGIAAADLIVVYDELDLPWGSLRIRPSGSAGGHNGVKSVIAATGSQDFVRVRLGIHGGSGNRDGARIVLAKLKRAQKEELDELLDYASQAVESIIADGVEMAMTKFNRRAGGLQEDQ